MTAAVEILGLVLMIVGVFAGLAFAVQWTRFFADWLWLLPSAPKLTMGVSLVAMILVAGVIRLAMNIPLNGPLAVSIEFAVLPILTVYAANGAAFLRVKLRDKAAPAHAWRHFIFDARREAQRDAYEAPRNAPL